MPRQATFTMDSSAHFGMDSNTDLKVVFSAESSLDSSARSRLESKLEPYAEAMHSRAEFGERVESSEKEALNEILSQESTKDESPSGLKVSYLIAAYGALFAALLVCVPKIWLSSSIYYTSRDITKLQTQSDLLKEENKRLKNEREALRYQYLSIQANSNP